MLYILTAAQLARNWLWRCRRLRIEISTTPRKGVQKSQRERASSKAKCEWKCTMDVAISHHHPATSCLTSVLHTCICKHCAHIATDDECFRLAEMRGERIVELVYYWQQTEPLRGRQGANSHRKRILYLKLKQNVQKINSVWCDKSANAKGRSSWNLCKSKPQCAVCSGDQESPRGERRNMFHTCSRLVSSGLWIFSSGGFFCCFVDMNFD